ncbi:MAG TPA: molybdopterin cofactor-binding domain-containing protein [Bryobacteraceae bacterium]|jgi:CO/xanthine dehydrogenase Mo-binding subunit|nr:molybdopterin cofactor-binding domain-containing protein [Bryobacteraceae bacterium]
MKTASSLSRRDLLKSGGALVVSFSFTGFARKAAAQAPGKPLDPRDVDSFLAVHEDGSVTVYTGKVDVGTGLRIAVRQMASEELGVPVGRIALVEGDTGLTPDQGGTGGSTGLTRGGTEVRQAAATARQALLKLGSAKLGRPEAELTIADAEVRPMAGGSGVGIGALIGGRQFDLKVDPKAPLRDPSRYAVVGKPLLRPDLPNKCTARHTYLQDFTLPGMLHGRVIRPPAIGAKLLSVDETSIRDIPDTRVVRQENFLGVVAKDEWAAVRAARELKATWSDWQGLPGNGGLERYLREGEVDRDQTLVNQGDSAAAMASAARQLSATYFWPCQSHASLGPSCAVADLRADGLTVWTASQSTHGMRGGLSKILGVPEAKVRVVYMDGAGSYGGNGNDDAAADAALLSKAVGQPVRVQWMRQDEHGWDPKGPQQLLDVRAGLDAEGRIAAWETQMWLPTTVPGSRPYLGIDAAGIPQPQGQGAGQLSQNGDPPYHAPHMKVVVHWLKQTPLRPSNLRAPGKVANVFAVESFTDELASAAAVDALEFRERGMTDPRALEVLRRAARMIGWQARPSPNPNAAQAGLLTGRGLAYVRYKQAENYVAIAMEVAVERATGKINVRRVTCAHDCGLVVNPNALRNQIEGCIVQTLSRTLHEEVKFDASRVTSVDWASYPILRFPEVPAIEVELIDHPELPLLGAGEAATAPVAAALGNAIFDATGARLRTVPFTVERVQTALRKG